MALDYELSVENIKQHLEAAHDPILAIIRGQFFDAEWAFFRKNIFDQRVLVAGSGLGHDSFELAKYNKQVLGIELLEPLVEYSKNKLEELGLTNVSFEVGDITHLDFLHDKFDSAILNMGTIGNFDDKKKIISELLKVSDKVYFDFYLTTETCLEKRKRMYAEEKWINVRIEKFRIMSDDGLDSVPIYPAGIDSIVSSLGAKVKYHQFHEFSVMVEIEK